MTEIDTVRALNSIFQRYGFSDLRDVIERSDPDDVTSGIAELDEFVAETLTDDVVIEFHGGAGVPEGRRYEGREEYLRFWRGWLPAFETYEIEHGDYELIGDNVLVTVVHHGTGRGSGLAFDLPQAQRWVMRDGRAAEIHVYASRSEALADAG
jgi:ketosteroid isomerase-like protein